MSSRSLLLSSCSPSERMMKREFHLYLYNIDGGRTMVSHRTRRREGNGGQRRKRPTAEEEDLPSASAPLRKGGEFPRDPRYRRRGVVARAAGCQPVDDRATSGGGTTPASRGSGDPRCCACARAKPTRPWKKERSRRFCLPCGFRQCLAEVRGACFSPWCVLQEVG